MPLAGKEKLTLRLRDTDSDKVKVLNYNRPTPPEYRLSQSQVPALSSLPNFQEADIREHLRPVQTRQPLDNVLYLLALGSALVGILLRRV